MVLSVTLTYGSLADTVERLRYEVLLRLIQARSDLLWLHAGAAAYQCNSVMILGSWGRSKRLGDIAKLTWKNLGLGHGQIRLTTSKICKVSWADSPRVYETQAQPKHCPET